MNTTDSEKNAKSVTKRAAPRGRIGFVRLAAVGATAAAIVGGLFAGSATANAAIVGGDANLSTGTLTITVEFSEIYSNNPIVIDPLFGTLSGAYCYFKVDADVKKYGGLIDNGESRTFSGSFSPGEHRVQSICEDAGGGSKLLDSRTVVLRSWSSDVMKRFPDGSLVLAPATWR